MGRAEDARAVLGEKKKWEEEVEKMEKAAAVLGTKENGKGRERDQTNLNLSEFNLVRMHRQLK